MSRARPRRRPAAPSGARVLEILPRPFQVPCQSCGLCCTYVTAPIDPPTTVARAVRILWFLYHERVAVYREDARDWLVQFETRCRFFTAARTCAIYARRPQVCRDFDPRQCEVNAPDEGLTFHEPAAFLEWLRARRPRLHARLLASGQVPGADELRRPPPPVPALEPFARRYAALRALGAKGPPA